MELCSCSTTLPSKPAVPSFPFHPPPLSSTSPFPSKNALPPPVKPAAASVSTCRRGAKWPASPALGLAPITSVLKRCRSLGGTAVAMASSSPPPPPASVIATAAAVVRDYYDGINRRDLESVAPLISEACVYEDLIFSAPFVGRKAIMNFLERFTESIGSDLQFVMDDISTEDSSAVGVSWHLEWRGRPFPFSRGCSFYRLEVLDGKRQIVYGRDSVEPAIKPGDMALVLIRGVTSILQQFPQLADRF